MSASRAALSLAVALHPALLLALDPEPPALRLPPGARPTLYEVELTVVPTEATFKGEVRVRLELARATSLLWLNAAGLTIDRASVSAGGRARGAKPLPGGEDFVGFAFEEEVGPGEAVLAASFHGTIDDVRSRGLYRVREPDGQWYAYTFFEPIDARRVFPASTSPPSRCRGGCASACPARTWLSPTPRSRPRSRRTTA
jgi:aminopeptidase N